MNEIAVTILKYSGVLAIAAWRVINSNKEDHIENMKMLKCVVDDYYSYIESQVSNINISNGEE